MRGPVASVVVLLVTGATGTIGRPLLRRLAAGGAPVRCLVRDPARVAVDADRVQAVDGDLADPAGFDRAVEGVHTVVHLASVIRDQPGGSIEELTDTATCRLVDAARSAGVRRFVFFSVIGAAPNSQSRLLRAKVRAERYLTASPLAHTVFALGWAYARDDPFVSLTQRMSVLPFMPISGSGRARFQPIWAEDVADCVVAALPGGRAGREAENERFELAGPETLSYAQIVDRVLAASGRRRRLVRVPLAVVRPALELLERGAGTAAFATWDEVALLELTLLSDRGLADAERLGVTPRRLHEALTAT